MLSSYRGDNMDINTTIEHYTDPAFSQEKVLNKRKISAIHYHEHHHELYYLIDGTTKYFVGDEIFLMKKGNFIFIPKGMLHKTDSEECLHNERILISFDDSVFTESTKFLLDELTLSKLSYIPDKNRYKLEEILNLLKKEYDRPDEYSKNLQKLYTVELLTLICRYRRNFTPKVSEADKIVFEISDYIRNSYHENISLKALSEKFAVSESHLSRKFKEVSGTGINEYITSVRIMNAEILLKENKHSITEIANKCGFNDSNYFSTVFKRIKGITPLKFANKTE